MIIAVTPAAKSFTNCIVPRPKKQLWTTRYFYSSVPHEKVLQHSKQHKNGNTQIPIGHEISVNKPQICAWVEKLKALGETGLQFVNSKNMLFR